MKDRKHFYYLIAPITIFSIAFTGYRFAVSDQCIYIPIMRRILDPSLYPGDYLFEQPSGKYSILLPIVAYLSKLFTMQWVFFIGYIAAISGLFWVVYKIAFSLFRNRGVACIAILLLCISRRPDQAIVTQETFFTLQPVAMPFSLMTLYFFIEERYTLAAVFNAIAFLVHPIIAMPSFLLLALYLISNLHRLSLRTISKTFGVFFLITIPLFMGVVMSKGSGFQNFNFFRIASKEWMDILYRRNTYAFPALWNRSSWEHVFSLAVLLAASMFLKIMYAGAAKKDRKALWIVVTSFGTLGIAHLFGSVIPIALVFQLQLARGLYMFMYIAFIYAAYVIWAGYQARRFFVDRAIIVVSAAAIATGKEEFVVLGISTCIILWLPTKLSKHAASIFGHAATVFGVAIAGLIVFLSSKDFVLIAIICTPLFLFTVVEFLKRIKMIEWKFLNRYIFLYILLIVILAAKIHKGGLGVQLPYLKPPDTWTKVQYWAAANTPKEAVFIVPPDTKGFRNFSKRTIVGDNKDGAPGLFSESYDLEWSRRMKQLQSYEKFEDERFIELAREYKASFVVTRRGQKLKFPKVYENSDFCVYNLPRTVN